MIPIFLYNKKESMYNINVNKLYQLIDINLL